MPSVAVDTATPFQLVYADNNTPGSIVNLDLTNNIVVGKTQSDCYLGLGAVDNFIVGPLNFVAVEAQQDYWCVAQSGNPSVQFMPGVTNWAPSPVQAALQISASGLATSANQVTTQNTLTSGIALPVNAAKETGGNLAGLPTNIAATGVPLLKLHKTIATPAAQTLTVGTPVTLGPFSFSQIGYSLFFDTFVTSGAVLSFLEVSVIWLDSTTGLAIDQQIYWFNVGTNGGNPHGIRIVGPTEGNQIQITLTAFGSGITVTGPGGNILLFQSSTPYARHFPLTTVMTSLSGVTNVAFNDPLAFVLGDISATALLTGANQATTIAAYSGRVAVFGGTTSGTTDLSLNISNTSDQTSAGSHTIFQQNSDAKGFVNAYTSLPRSQQVVTITNQNAGTQSCRFTIVAAPEG